LPKNTKLLIAAALVIALVIGLVLFTGLDKTPASPLRDQGTSTSYTLPSGGPWTCGNGTSGPNPGWTILLFSKNAGSTPITVTALLVGEFPYDGPIEFVVSSATQTVHGPSFDETIPPSTAFETVVGVCQVASDQAYVPQTISFCHSFILTVVSNVGNLSRTLAPLFSPC